MNREDRGPPPLLQKAHRSKKRQIKKKRKKIGLDNPLQFIIHPEGKVWKERQKPANDGWMVDDFRVLSLWYIVLFISL